MRVRVEDQRRLADGYSTEAGRAERIFFQMSTSPLQFDNKFTKFKIIATRYLMETPKRKI
jgi:hypothetical protein